MSAGGFNRPQRKRYLRRGIAGGLLLVAIFMLLADKQQTVLLNSGRLSADDPSAKIMGILAAPLRGVEKTFTSFGDRTAAFKQNRELKAEVQRLRDVEHRVLDLELRLKIYEDLLEMDNGIGENVDRIIARTVSEVEGPFVHSALINVGRDKNVSVGHAVATADGLIGHVVRTGNSSARVLLLNDLNSHISVLSQRSQSRAIMVGTNSAKPKLDYISRQGDWQAGDRVVTSGDDGILPAGLKIGVVEQAGAQELNVRLFTQDKPIDWVWVYMFTPLESPPETLEPVEVETPEPQPDSSGLQ